MKKSLLLFLSGFGLAVFFLMLYAGKSTEKSEPERSENKSQENIADMQYIKIIHAPEAVDFAGEKVPLEYFDIRESLERELNVMTYGHNLTILTARLSKRYFPIIEPILKEQNVPDDFKYLCVAESNLQNLISTAKATGFWQFLSGTAKQYGLEVNDEVDERYHLEKSTVAACKYLKEAYARYGNWTLAAASYNTGMGNIDKAVAEQNTRNYYDMSLNLETSRYVFRMLGYKIILNNLEQHGFHISDSEYFDPLQYSEVSVKEPIPSIADFAEKHGTNYKMIKLLNPWLRKAKLTNKIGKTYKIKIPTKEFRSQ